MTNTKKRVENISITPMELLNMEGSPIQGSFPWYLETDKQDFCYGAKTLTSPQSNLGFSTPPGSSSTFNEQLNTLEEVPGWMEISDLLGDDNLETFSDVIFPGNVSFGPEDCFKEVFENEMKPPHVPTLLEPRQSNNVIQIKEDPPKITIKLKKVKGTRNVKQKTSFKIENLNENVEFKLVEHNESINNSEIYHTPLPKRLALIEQGVLGEETHKTSNPTLGKIWTLNEYDDDHTPLQGQVPLVENSLLKFDDGDFISLIDVDNELDSLLKEKNTSSLTLREALDSERADDFVKCLLSPSEISRNSYSPTNTIYLEDCEVESLGGNQSPFSSSSVTSFAGSPHFENEIHIDQTDYMDFDLEFSSYQTLIANSPGSSSNDNVSSDERKTSKKRQRQKLSRESRYLRKKEQNKQAAIRYRMKKKQEGCHVNQILEKEQKRQEELTKEYADLKKEVSIMKKLLKEAFVAKKLI